MSFLKSIKSHTPTPSVTQMTTYSKLEKTNKELSGFIVEDFSFTTVDVTNDERKGLKYQYYSLTNLQALGVDGQLKMCVVAADNFKIADSYEQIVSIRTQAPAENNKA